jgi:hypothetical protein
VAAGANFVVERAVDLVLLGSENGGEIVGHGVSCWREEREEVNCHRVVAKKISVFGSE